MLKIITRLTAVILAMLLALPTVGCQEKGTETEKTKGVDVQIDVGKTKVKVEGTKTPDEKGRHVDVDVEHQGHEHPPTDGGK